MAEIEGMSRCSSGRRIEEQAKRDCIVSHRSQAAGGRVESKQEARVQNHRVGKCYSGWNEGVPAAAATNLPALCTSSSSTSSTTAFCAIESSSTRCCSLSNAAWHAARSPTSRVGRGGAARLQQRDLLHHRVSPSCSIESSRGLCTLFACPQQAETCRARSAIIPSADASLH